jgi:hypothetical protein
MELRAGNNKPQVFVNPAFRYAIIYVDPGYDEHRKEITVLMDPTEFTEKNLRTLFLLLSERYKNLYAFDAYIRTSLQDVPTPEQHGPNGYSEDPTINPKAGMSPKAIIRHSSERDALFIYSPSKGTETPPLKIDLRVPITS